MKQSDLFRQNAAHLAECAASRPLHLRYKRMESAWRALADEQDWLDGCRTRANPRGGLNQLRRCPPPPTSGRAISSGYRR